MSIGWECIDLHATKVYWNRVDLLKSKLNSLNTSITQIGVFNDFVNVLASIGDDKKKMSVTTLNDMIKHLITIN